MPPKWPIFKALSALRGAKIAQHGLKMDSFHLFVHPKYSKGIFGKTHFDPFLTDFLSLKQPFFKAFCDSEVAKMACNGLKKGSFHLFVHPKWCRIICGITHC